ncbi:hypothetical protein [Gymnodinialimonas sp.]
MKAGINQQFLLGPPKILYPRENLPARAFDVEPIALIPFASWTDPKQIFPVTGKPSICQESGMTFLILSQRFRAVAANDRVGPAEVGRLAFDRSIGGPLLAISTDPLEILLHLAPEGVILIQPTVVWQASRLALHPGLADKGLDLTP